jgi:hypothetical protein
VDHLSKEAMDCCVGFFYVQEFHDGKESDSMEFQFCFFAYLKKVTKTTYSN